MAETLPVERLRAYLQELKPEARAMLLAALERGATRGETVPGGDLILQELRRTLRNSADDEVSGQGERVNTAARLFFAPLDPFLVDDTEAEALPPGRIGRSALDPIWQ